MITHNQILSIVFIITVMITPVCAQKSKAARKAFRLGEEAVAKADYLPAFRYFAEVLKEDPTNTEALFYSGISVFGMNKSDTSALKYFLAVKDKKPESHFYLGRIFHLRGNTRIALEEFYLYKASVAEEELAGDAKQWIKACENEIKLESQRENYIIRNLGENVNSKYPDYVPLIWNLNGSLVFTSRRDNSKGGAKDPYGRFYEDIYLAKRTADGWENPLPLSDSLNTGNHDACVAFSPDGTELIIYRTDAKQTGGDFYLSKYDGNSWSSPVIMNSQINSEYLEASACYSADGNEIIFSSNRPGGFGGKDLYRIVRFMNGKYSKPFNLGSEINTEEDEDAPFIDNKDNSLYFSSRGHNTIGEYDIFKSEFNSETNRWKSPINLGIPINSTNDDIYFMKLSDDKSALFASRRDGGLGDADIYEVDLSANDPLVIYCRVNGSLVDTSKVKNLQLSLYSIESGKLEGIFRPGKGRLNMVLVAMKEREYKLILEGSNIEPVVKTISFNEAQKEMVIDLKEKL
jgi:hypothetical protein